MNKKNILLFGKDSYQYLFSVLNEIIPAESDLPFLFKRNLFIYDKLGQNLNLDIFSEFENLKLGKFFNIKDFFTKFIDNFSKIDQISKNIDLKNLNIEEMYDALRIDEIVSSHSGKTLKIIYEQIKQKIIIFLSLIIDRDLNLEKEISSLPLEFYYDDVKKKFNDHFDSLFHSWLKDEYKKIDYLFHRYIYMADAVDFLIKTKNDVEVNSNSKIIFNESILGADANSKSISELYLKIEKSKHFFDLLRTKTRSFDSVYSLLEVNLFKGINMNLLMDKFVSNKNELIKYNPITNLSHESSYFESNNNIDLIEYFPDLDTIEILDSSSFDLSNFLRIIKNPFLRKIKFYLTDFENKDNFLSKIKNFISDKIELIIISAKHFIDELTNEETLRLQKITTLKYEVIWSEPMNFKNTIVYPIRSLVVNKTHHIKEGTMGGYVSTIYNLSQINDSWISLNSFVIDDARIIENAIINEKTIIKENVIVRGFSSLKNCKIQDRVIIKDNAKLDTIKAKGNAFIYKNSVILGNSSLKIYPKISSSASIGTDKGTIEGNVIIDENANLSKIVNIINTSSRPMHILGNAQLRGYIKIEDNVLIGDNASLEGQIILKNSVKIYGNASLKGNIEIYHNSQIYDNAQVGADETKIIISGNSKIFENVKIFANALIFNNSQLFGSTTIFNDLKMTNNAKIFANVKILKSQTNFTISLEGEDIFGTNWLRTLKRNADYEKIVELVELSYIKKATQKYRITNEFKNVWNEKLQRGVLVYRIQALIDFSDVRKNQLGGFVQSIDNLEGTGKAWIYDNAIVYGNAKVTDSGRVYNNVIVSENALVGQEAIIFGNATISGSSRILGKALIFDHTKIENISTISAKAKIRDNVIVKGNSWIYDDVEISNKIIVNNSFLSGKSILKGTTQVESSSISDSNIFGNNILESSLIRNSKIFDNTIITKSIVDNSVLKDISYISDSMLSRVMVSGNSWIKNSKITESIIMDLTKIESSNVFGSDFSNYSTSIDSSIMFSKLEGDININKSLVQNSIIKNIASIKWTIVKSSVFSGNIDASDSKISLSRLRNILVISNSSLNQVSTFDYFNISSSIINSSVLKSNNSFKNKSIIGLKIFDFHQK